MILAGLNPGSNAMMPGRKHPVLECRPDVRFWRFCRTQDSQHPSQ
jgi:hypothetical protein